MTCPANTRFGSEMVSRLASARCCHPPWMPSFCATMLRVSPACRVYVSPLSGTEVACRGAGACLTGAFWTGALLAWVLCTGALCTGALWTGAPPPPLSPSCDEQDGQAPQPWEAWTRSATAICCSRLAFSGEPVPPYADQVLEVNCRPPEKPLPVLVDQLPPLSHCASASHVDVGVAALAAVAERAKPAAETAARVTPRRAAVRNLVFFMMVMLLKATSAGSVPGDRRATARP